MSETIGVMGIHEDVIVRFDSSAHFQKFKWGFLAFYPPVWDGSERSPWYPYIPIDDSLHPVGILGAIGIDIRP
jgi:hypothetical protein